MSTMRFLVVAMLISAVALVGCGGKKAIDEPPPTDAGGTPTGSPGTESPVENVPPGGTDVGGAMALSDVFFDFDQYNLSAEAKGTLEANARELKNQGERAITIEGHCDERGTQAYNLALGEKRAGAAKDYLIALGVGAGRITTVSYGKERPFETGSSESAWAKNRRAHFVSQ